MKICANCGREIPEEYKFCGFCGTAFEEVEDAETIEQVAETEIEAEAAEGPAEEVAEEPAEEEAEEAETEAEAEPEVEAEAEVAEEAETETEPETTEEEVADEATEETGEEPAEEPEEVEEPAEEEPAEEIEETVEEPAEEVSEEPAEEVEEPAEEATENTEEAEEETEEPFTIEDLEEDQEKNGTEVSSPTLALGLDYNYEQAEAEMAKINAAQYVEAERKPLVSKKTLIKLGVAALIVVVAIVAFNVVSTMSSTTKVDLAEFMTEPEYGGVDGSGIIVTEAVIDEQKVDEFMSSTNDIDERFAIKSFFNGVVLSADKETNLTEGDEITITARYSEKGAEDAGLKITNNVKTVTVGKLDVLDASLIGTWVMVGAERNGWTLSMRRLGRDYNPEPTFEMQPDGTGIVTIKELKIKGNVIIKNGGNYELKTSDTSYPFYIDGATLRMDYVVPTDEEDEHDYYEEPEMLVLLFEK
ncbi:MAG: hypothetical protein KBS66_00995 [Eubacterium sp.]|nr:hypothetical protein [Candidatus Colimonas fimequi]